jgi:biopolymer transport protein ExbD
MRQRHALKNRVGGLTDMTPMIDMVFILVIFLLVNTSFVKETGINVNRPAAQTAVRQEHGNILIGIRDNGEIWMENRPVDLRAVRAHVERMHAENPGGAVVIVADKGAKTGILVQVMDQARLAGVPNVSIAAAREP